MPVARRPVQGLHELGYEQRKWAEGADAAGGETGREQEAGSREDPPAMVLGLLDQLSQEARVGHGDLRAHDAFEGGDLGDLLRAQHQPRDFGEVVEVDGEASLPRHGGDVGPRLSGVDAPVGGKRGHHRVAASLLGAASEIDGLSRSRRTRAANHRDPPRGRRGGRGHHALLLLDGEIGKLPVRAQHHDRIQPRIYAVLDEMRDPRLVDLVGLGEGGREDGGQTGELLHVHSTLRSDPAISWPGGAEPAGRTSFPPACRRGTRHPS